MNTLFIDDLLEALENEAYEVKTGNQEMVKNLLEEEREDFPMICYEYTPDSNIEVSIDESKFLNDSTHKGSWIVGGNDESSHFIINLQSYDIALEIDVFEVNKALRGEGIGGNIISIIESTAEPYYKKITLSVFDTDAMNFWEHMGYVENNRGQWVKNLGE